MTITNKNVELIVTQNTQTLLSNIKKLIAIAKAGRSAKDIGHITNNAIESLKALFACQAFKHNRKSEPMVEAYDYIKKANLVSIEQTEDNYSRILYITEYRINQLNNALTGMQAECEYLELITKIAEAQYLAIHAQSERAA